MRVVFVTNDGRSLAGNFRFAVSEGESVRDALQKYLARLGLSKSIQRIQLNAAEVRVHIAGIDANATHHLSYVLLGLPVKPAKVVLVLLDGLRDDAARDHMGYLEHLVERKRAARHHVQTELPTLSRPLYATILTGVPPVEHGILSNRTGPMSRSTSIFHRVRAKGKTTAAVAYFWFSELYVRVPYDIVRDLELDDLEQPAIQHGRFYSSLAFPDIEVFLQAALLLEKHAPDFLLCHAMHADTTGHEHGAASKQYREAVEAQDQILANFVPRALSNGYRVVITSDHGMSDDGSHNGSLPAVRSVPLYIAHEPSFKKIDLPSSFSQLEIANILRELLQV